MRIDSLSLVDFRNYADAELTLAGDGLTVVVGGNGEGKTNLVEAIAYLATLRSFRGSPGEALVRAGRPRAVVRGRTFRGRRELLIEAELTVAGRDRVQVNRQALRRSRDMLGLFQVSVFGPDDLALVKGGPAERRRYLDDTLVGLTPALDALRGDLERVLRQRNSLLKQAGGRLSPEVAATLDVWDEQLARLGSALTDHRMALLTRLAPSVGSAYRALTGGGAAPGLEYEPSWQGPLADVLASRRAEDLRRGLTTAGPHRDDVAVSLGRLPVRTHASQGEQRSVALALRLAAHLLATEDAGEPPVLLLDDVFSELDPHRSAALLASLPPGQAVLTTAAAHLPKGVEAGHVVSVSSGRLQTRSSGEMAVVAP
ncbi:MAG: DNA replication/repair protein RecF [Acidimicrobiales bacterium]